MRITCLAALLLAVPLAAQKPPSITQGAWQRTRAIWFGQAATPTIAAEIGLGHEDLAWNADLGKTWDAAGKGDRMALATTAWATFETFTDLAFGKVAVKAGNYYAVLEKGTDGWQLGLLDSEKVRAAGLEPGTGGKLPLVAAIPLAETTGSSETLRATWTVAEGGGSADLQVQFGPHTLAAHATVAGSEKTFALAQPAPRRSSRIAFAPAKGGKLGFAFVDHGAPGWQDGHAEAAKGMKPGQRWRLGQDWATTLDSNLPLAIGGKKLAAGSWHLTLAKAPKAGWNLVISSAAADHKAKIDGFNADAVQPVLEVPLQSARLEPVAAALRVEFESAGPKAQLAIAFGSTKLTATVAPL